MSLPLHDATRHRPWSSPRDRESRRLPTDDKLGSKVRAFATHVEAAIRNFRGVASLMPSSTYVGRSVARLLEPQYRHVVEYGPGTGTVTRELLQRLSPDATVVAIEAESRFEPELDALGDPRLRVVIGDVLQSLPRLKPVFPEGLDAVVSGIPFSFFAPEVRDRIVRETRERLRPGGKFIAYQHSRLLVPLMKRYFRKTESRLEPRNLFPYFVMTATV